MSLKNTISLIRFLLFSPALFAVGVSAGDAPEKTAASPFVMVNGNIITMDEKDTRAQAMAVKDGKIMAVGTSSEIETHLLPGWRKINLEGKTVLPGFIDCHSHLDIAGAYKTFTDGSKLRSIDAILSVVKQQAMKTPAGQLIAINNINQNNLKEQRPPTRYELDRGTTDHPVILIHYTIHQAYLNSAAVKLFGINASLDGADADNGIVNGILRDPASVEIIGKALGLIPKENITRGILAVSCEALKHGISTIHTMQGSELYPDAAKDMLALADQLPVHLVVWNSSNDTNKLFNLKLPRLGGCSDFMADGEITSHTAAIFEPYNDLPLSRGTLLHTQEYWDKYVLVAYAHNLQFAAHAETEAGIETVLWAMEKANAFYPNKKLRCRIEHLEMPTMTQLERMNKIGVIASMQPAFVDLPAQEMAALIKAFGDTRMQRYNPLKDVVDHGIIIAGGSDSPVTPYNPIAGIYSAVNHPIKTQRVSVKEAVKMFTVNAAYSAFEENEKGTLEVGKIADMVVLSADPFSIPVEKLREIKVEKTFVAGREF
ncbi:MAG: amidohydrolase [Verrucomicrobia bacterium]|nr:amidohydrolase [Verrucomicrobiota bacterium]MBU1736155.1 amidohydrolase [Verrucomicrobiota bacterium]MBU1856755.1 amidohydrolase [Verrucomicrobiota bacterium]